MHLILIGLRGSGKTTIGRALAAQFGLVFVDLDDLTVKALGTGSVSEAWRVKGEKEFRHAEVEALRVALAKDNQVLALGGGTPTAPGAAELIKKAQASGARVVYLRASAAALRSRLEGITADRPSLTGADPLVEIDVVFAKRDPTYMQLADEVVNVDAMTPEGAAGAVRQSLEND